MPEDLDVLKRVWDSKIPIRFHLAPEEIVSDDRSPSPFYVHASRLSYFPLIIDRVVRYFIEFTEFGTSTATGQRSVSRCDLPEDPVQTGDSKTQVVSKPDCLPEFKVWLEYANQPLKWHYPIGLLFDLHANEMDLPWKLVVHFQGYPNDVLLAPPVNRRAIEVHFMSTLKEADALKHRSQVMNQMQARDHRQLWTGLLNFQFDQYWSVNQKLMCPVSSVDPQASGALDLSGASRASDSPTPDSQTSLKGFRLLPFRLYCTAATGSGTTTGYIQRRLRPFAAGGAPLTLIEAMHQLLQPDKEHEHDCASHPELENFQFIVHGIPLPKDVPVQWLCEHLAYADNFVHIVARSNAALATA